MTGSDPRSRRICLFQKYILFIAVVSMFCAGLSYAEQYSDSNGYAVLLEESPAGAGYVTPEVGIHEDKGGVMDIRAVPKPGYRFLYWLGDVEDSSENETTVNVDSPKIVIAVFSRTTDSAASTALTPSPAIGGLRPSSLPSENSYYGATTYPDPTDPEDPHDNPVPEPSTVALLAAGAILTCRKRR